MLYTVTNPTNLPPKDSLKHLPCFYLSLPCDEMTTFEELSVMRVIPSLWISEILHQRTCIPHE